MNESITVDGNPIGRMARSLPARTGVILSLGGRIAGVALAAGIAIEQDYGSTRIFAAAIAALVLITCLPFPPRLRSHLAWIGAALQFFGGAILAHLPAGVVVLLCGAVAAIGALVDEQQHHRPSAALTFFAGFAVTMALVVAIVLGRGG